MLSHTEENYLKVLFHLTVQNEQNEGAGTNELAVGLGVKPATVNDMLKRLKQKGLVHYEKYGKVTLSKTGQKRAVQIVRKHRLWETFLFEKLNFTWDEVHEVAEQLEHIQSVKLIEQLEIFLSYPQFDPHGDSIPDARGIMPQRKSLMELTAVSEGKIGYIRSVGDNSASFLKHLNRLGLGIGSKLKVREKLDFDGTMEIEVNKNIVFISGKFAAHIYVEIK